MDVGMLLTASILCTALSACAQPGVWPGHQPLQHGSGSPQADELVQRLATPRHARHHALVEPVSHRDCPLQPLRALQQAAGRAGPPVDVLIVAAFSYEPHTARAFLSTFRRHNQAARLILLVFPVQVPSRTKSPFARPAALACLPPAHIMPTRCPVRTLAVQTKAPDPSTPAQWHELKDPFCEYHKRYGVDYFSVEPLDLLHAVPLALPGNACHSERRGSGGAAECAAGRPARHRLPGARAASSWPHRRIPGWQAALELVASRRRRAWSGTMSGR